MTSFFYLCVLWGTCLVYPSMSFAVTRGQMTLLTADQKRYPIENKKVNESSGLACSTRDKHLIWTHNDSGHMPIIYAMDHKGKDLGSFHLDDIENYDWEDMDAFVFQGKHYLLLADTGDNLRMRWDYRISVIKEPELNSKRHSTISPAWSFSFKYEDGQSYDVESVAVDVLREKIILITKRTSHAMIFELPLKPNDTDTIQIAAKAGEFQSISKASALDISADGQLMSVNTYRRVHRFRRNLSDNTWHYVNSLKYKKLFQPEAMCLRMDEKFYYVTSERKPYLIKLKAQ